MRNSQKFAVNDVDALRKLNADGHEVDSKFSHDLKRAPNFVPLEAQDREISAATLETTCWKLTQLGAAPVTAASQQQEPHFVVNSEANRVSGSGGCNRLTGGYERKGDHLPFMQMAGTMMACAQGTDTGKAFLNALTAVKAWRISGQQLELFGADGHQLARLEARYMK